MQISIADSINRDYLVLGVQTSVEGMENTKRHTIISWAPSKAKSYTATELRHEDYDGYPADKPTGYGSFEVRYFTTVNEGEHKLPPRVKEYV